MTWVIIAAITITVWAISLWVHPWRPCPRCTPKAAQRGGAGRNPGSRPTRFGSCGRCDGTGKITRPGAKMLHRAIAHTTRPRHKKEN